MRCMSVFAKVVALGLFRGQMSIVRDDSTSPGRTLSETVCIHLASSETSCTQGSDIPETLKKINHCNKGNKICLRIECSEIN